MTSARAYVTCFLLYLIPFEDVGAYNREELMHRKSRAETSEKSHSLGSNEISLDVTRRARSHGYSATEHYVETEDGYGLTLFRLQRRSGNVTVKGPPVLIMHGLLQTSASWIDAGPSAGLAYLLANAGHDVWLGNVRGTHYSRQHAWLNPDTDPQYWQFCTDEIGRYDVPASIDYVLRHTDVGKLNYIGFSQGAKIFFIMCSERPGYCDEVNIMVALAPATRLLNTKSAFFRLLCEYYAQHEQEFINAGHFEAFPKGGFLQTFLQSFCSVSNEATNLCEAMKGVLDAPHPKSITRDTYRIAMAGFPAGTSTHNLAGYGQSVKAKEFQKFDYGPDGNLALYSSRTPPIYNLTSVTVPTVILYGRNDGMVDREDVQWLIGKLPNVVEAMEVKDPLWTHLDMCFSHKVPKLVYPKIAEYFNRYS